MEEHEETLQERCDKLSRENELLRRHSLPSPTSVLESVESDFNTTMVESEADFTTPLKRKARVCLDVYNKCAKAILDHQHEKGHWRQYNYIDDLTVKTKLLDEQHYLLCANKSTAKYGNGSLINCLKKMRFAKIPQFVNLFSNIISQTLHGIES